MDTKFISYLYGLLGTDGSVRIRNSCIDIRLELSEKDKDIIENLHKIIDNSSISNRTRDTNFKNNYTTYSLSILDKNLAYQLLEMGFPTSDKTNTIGLPIGEYDIYSFWRGIIDGDGSLGFRTKGGAPFVGLVTKSEHLKNAFVEFIEDECGYTIQCSRNKRDNVYNLSVQSINAQKIVNKLYNNDEIAIQRKKDIAKKILEWEPSGRQGQHSYRWTIEELDYLRHHSVNEFLEYFPNRRTKNAVKCKKSALRKEMM